MAVFATPGALLALRLVDDSDVAFLVQPAQIALAILFLVLVGIAMRLSASRSGARALTGGGGAVLAAALLALPMIHVIGERSCPERMGTDFGTETSVRLLEAWRRGESAPAEVWTSDAVAGTWRPRADAATLLDYRLVASGCWERLAPVATKTTWHEFRVTIQKGTADPYSKTMTVHTRAAHGRWRISGIDGPEA